MKNASKILAGNLEGKRPFESPGISGRIILQDKNGV
jgi:hypothetical protein